jgi:hypothetical protein
MRSSTRVLLGLAPALLAAGCAEPGATILVAATALTLAVPTLIVVTASTLFSLRALRGPSAFGSHVCAVFALLELPLVSFLLAIGIESGEIEWMLPSALVAPVLALSIAASVVAARKSRAQHLVLAWHGPILVFLSIAASAWAFVLFVD